MPPAKLSCTRWGYVHRPSVWPSEAQHSTSVLCWPSASLTDFVPLLQAAPRPGPELLVRINPPSGDASLAQDDLEVILPSTQLQGLLLPKVETANDIRLIIERAEVLRPNSEYARVTSRAWSRSLTRAHTYVCVSLCAVYIRLYL